MDLIEKQNEVIHEVINEMYSMYKQQKVLLVDRFISQKFKTVNMDFLDEPERISEIMEEKGLIVRNKNTGLDKLTNFGKQIAESKDGWLGYLKSKTEQADKPPTIIVRNETKWYDWVFRAATLFGIVTTFYFSYTDSAKGKKILELESKHSRQQSVIDSLSREVLNRDTVLLREKVKLRKHVIDSLQKNLKAKK